MGRSNLIAKAVALTHVGQYQNPPAFNAIINQVRPLPGNERLRGLRGIANVLYKNHYMRQAHLNADDIGGDPESIAELLEILYPLTGLLSAQ